MRYRWLGALGVAAALGVGGYIVNGSGTTSPRTLIPKLTAPASGATLSGSITMSATCAGCEAVEFTVNGNRVTACTKGDPACWTSPSTFTGIYNTTRLADQEHSFDAIGRRFSSRGGATKQRVICGALAGMTVTNSIGATTITVDSSAGFLPQDAILVGSEAATIASLTSSTITLTSGLTVVHTSSTSSPTQVTLAKLNSTCSSWSKFVAPAVRATTSNSVAPATAHLWVDSLTGNDTTCTRSSSVLAFSAAAGHICATITKAVALATTASTIAVKYGTGANYGDVNMANKTNVTLEGDPDGPWPVVNDVRGDSADTCTFKYLRLAPLPGDLPFFDMRVQNNTTVSDLDIESGTIETRGATNPHFIRIFSHDGPHYDVAGAQGFPCGCGIIATGDSTTGRKTTGLSITGSVFLNMAGDGIGLNVVGGAVVSGNRFDTSDPYGTGDHVDAIQILGGSDITYTNNFVTNWQHGILITDFTPQDGSDSDSRAMTITNNVICHKTGSSFNGPPGPNSLVANNTFCLGISGTNRIGKAQDAASNSIGSIFKNNIIVNGSLGVGTDTTADYNCAKAHATTGIHDVITGSVIPLNSNFTLAGGSVCLNMADNTVAPPFDLLAQPRPDVSSGLSDAGALEKQ